VILAPLATSIDPVSNGADDLGNLHSPLGPAPAPEIEPARTALVATDARVTAMTATNANRTELIATNPH
jgi:hypothetical protein